MLHRPGAWIFVSHSLRDFQQVRNVRNALEDRGHFPLLFYLRSLADDAEVDALIRKEIQARNFFLLCDSENARASRWVQEEIKIIKSQPRRVLATVDLHSAWEDQLRVIEAVSVRISVYVSAAAADRLDADAIEEALQQADYSVLAKPKGPTPVADVHAHAIRDIHEAMSSGLVLVLLSPERLTQQEGFHWLELREALDHARRFDPRRPTIIPIVVRDFRRTMELLPHDLRVLNALDVSHLHHEAKAATVVQTLDQVAPQIDA